MNDVLQLRLLLPILLLLPWMAQGVAEQQPGLATHPLMPGVRSIELRNVDWPRTYHDKLVTGFSPLVCGMQKPPVIWSTIAVDTTFNWVQTVRSDDGRERLLVYDGRLRLVDPTGNVQWSQENIDVSHRGGAVLYYGALRGPGRDYLLLANGPRLTLVDAVTGQVEWTHRFEPSYVAVGTNPRSVVVADILVDRPGLEAAIYPLYSESGYLVNFPPQGEPVIIWQTPAVVPGEHAPGPGGGERADHGCWVQVDFSVPEAPIIWTVRHHRCRGFDAQNGAMLSTLIYEIGGSHKRNYGPAILGVGKNDRRLMCVVSQAVQFHVHAIELNRSGPSKLKWQHYHGELLKESMPGVRSLSMVTIDDIDNDGTTEIVYNLRDEKRQFRSFVLVRDAETGEIEAERADSHCERAVVSHGDVRQTWFVVRPKPSDRDAPCARVASAGGAPSVPVARAGNRSSDPAARSVRVARPGNRVGPKSGDPPSNQDLFLLRCQEPGKLEQVAHWPAASLWGPGDLVSPQGRRLVVKTTDERGAAVIRQYALDGDAPRIVAETEAPQLVNLRYLATLKRKDGSDIFIGAPATGPLEAVDWEGNRLWQLDVAAASPVLLSAADLDGDHRAELLAANPTDNRLHIYAFDDDGKATQLRTHPFPCTDPRSVPNPLTPVLYDLEGNGQLCVVCPGSSASGKSAVRAFRGDGSLLWETILDPQGPGGPPSRWAAGEFLPGPRAGVVVSSMAKQNDSIQGTYLLDGRTGQIVWQKPGYLHSGGIHLPHYPVGVPTAFDVDGDGVEEIGMDFYCNMAWLRGSDGEFVMRYHTANLGSEGALYAGRFHNSYIPVFREDINRRKGDRSGNDLAVRHWLVVGGFHGSVGLMNAEPTDGVWREELGYDMARKIGLVDVDGDGRMEVGYAPRSQTTFTCRDLWSGEIEWQLDLPEESDSPVLSADVDGDGRGEFLFGRYCLGTDRDGQGEIRWQAPVSLTWALIADFNGDGRGEIACFDNGRIHILQGKTTSASFLSK